MRPATEGQLTLTNQNGHKVHYAVVWRGHFLDVLRAASDKMWKYVGKHMELARQACVSDPTQMMALSDNIAEFPLVFLVDGR